MNTAITFRFPYESPAVDERRWERGRDVPAVGIVVSEETVDASVRVILRARQRGFPVLVAYSGTPLLEGLSLLAELDAWIVNPGETGLDEERLIRLLTETAAGVGYTGLIVHRHVWEYIDYDRSVSALETADTYAAEAITTGRDTAAKTIAAIPAYNVDDSIERVVKRAALYVDEVFIVDDGSSDDTAERAKGAGAIVLEHSQNRGYGTALHTAFREADRWKADHLVILDGDGQHNPDDIPKLLETQREMGAEIVIGSRFTDDSDTTIPWYRAIGLRTVNFLTDLATRAVGNDSRVRDTQSGYRAYDKNAIRGLAMRDSIGSGMEASTDILFHAYVRGYSVEEVGTTITYDVEQSSSLNPLSHGYRLVNNLVAIIERERPLTFLGVPGVASLFLGISLSYWLITNYAGAGMAYLGFMFFSLLFVLFGALACIAAVMIRSLRVYFSQRRLDPDT